MPLPAGTVPDGTPDQFIVLHTALFTDPLITGECMFDVVSFSAVSVGATIAVTPTVGTDRLLNHQSLMPLNGASASTLKRTLLSVVSVLRFGVSNVGICRCSAPPI